MKWHDLEQLWQTASPGSALPPWNVAEFEQQRRRFARTVARRDWLEAAVGGFVAIAFALPPIRLGAAAWPAWLAVALVLGVTGFFVRERWRARRTTPAPEAPLLTRLDAEIAELAHQNRLLRQATWWYVLPLLTAVGLLLWALHAALPGEVTPDMVRRLVWMGVMGLGLGGAVAWLNHWTARRSIEPRLRELQEARRTWRESDGPGADG